jgi:3-hydroxy-3-methylglutaryl CoA synthase
MSDGVGIDDLNLFASTLTLEARDLASARGTPSSQVERFEFLRRALPPAYEDPVTLAVNAARPIVEDAGADAFELLVVATETGIDCAKPLSSYVHKYLGLGRRCRNVQVKHACYAGTGALQLAASWARADADPGKRALVVMTDMGRRAFGHAGEPEQGAGAVALSVCKAPRVLTLERGSGYASSEAALDAAGTARGPEVPSDSPAAISSYLDLLEATWSDYRALHGARSIEQHFAYLAFHAPLPRLARHAFRWICDADREGCTPASVDSAFRRMVEPSFRYNRELGNIYSGSLYAALASLIDTAPDLAAGDRVGFYSYGSGACAEFFSGVLGAEARAMLGRHRIADRLAQRQRVTVAEYEAVMAVTERGLTSAEFVPDLAFPLLHYANAYEGRELLVLDRVRDYHREYRWS